MTAVEQLQSMTKKELIEELILCYYDNPTELNLSFKELIEEVSRRLSG